MAVIIRRAHCIPFATSVGGVHRTGFWEVAALLISTAGRTAEITELQCILCPKRCAVGAPFLAAVVLYTFVCDQALAYGQTRAVAGVFVTLGVKSLSSKLHSERQPLLQPVVQRDL